MTPQEKAKQLVEQFTFNCRECDNAILSAQFAVDEILSINSVDKDEDLSNYWEQVKQEIEKL